MAQKAQKQEQVIDKEMVWIMHYNRSLRVQAQFKAVSASLQEIAKERRELIASYNDTALLISDLSMSMTAFNGTKSQKQSLKRGLTKAFETVHSEAKITLQWYGNAVTIKDIEVKAKTNDIENAFGILSVYVPESVIEEMETIFHKAKTARETKIKTLQAKQAEQDEKAFTGRVNALLHESGLEANEANIQAVSAILKAKGM